MKWATTCWFASKIEPQDSCVDCSLRKVYFSAEPIHERMYLETELEVAAWRGTLVTVDVVKADRHVD